MIDAERALLEQIAAIQHEILNALREITAILAALCEPPPPPEPPPSMASTPEVTAFFGDGFPRLPTP